MRFMPKRQWFQFGLRTLLLATVGVAVVASVLGYHVRWMQQRRALLRLDGVYSAVDARSGAVAPGLLWAFGETGVHVIIIGRGQSNSRADLAAHAEHLFPEAIVTAVPNAP